MDSQWLQNLSRQLKLTKPELLSPAGNWDCVLAAVENGADAVYFGLKRFNARARAHNFTPEELPSLMEYLHERGLKGYVTLNTLLFSQELEAAQTCLEQIITAGADAVIVQDVGLLRLVRQLSPDFPIHASTQMSITSARGVEFAEQMGASITTLGRECSLKEIALLQQERLKNKPPQGAHQLPLEVFIHGALCLSLSGQCLASEALGDALPTVESALSHADYPISSSVAAWNTRWALNASWPAPKTESGLSRYPNSSWLESPLLKSREG